MYYTESSGLGAAPRLAVPRRVHRVAFGQTCGDTDIEPAWADEAFADDDALVDSPDPASRSGKTDRLVGYSRTARMVIVVVYLCDELIGVKAWKANETQTRTYWEDQR
jgi:hypothetical protein